MTVFPWAALLLGGGIGLVAGSFAGLLVDRLPRGEPVAFARSRCLSCGRALGWVDLIPGLSWPMLKGRCRTCRAPIPVAVWGVELLGGLLGTAFGVHFGFEWVLLPALTLIVPVLAIALIDLRHGVVFDSLAAALCLSALGVAGWTEGTVVGPLVRGVALGGGAVTLRWLFLRLTGREGLGSGDIALFAGAGLLLPVTLWPAFLLLAGLGGVGLGVMRRGPFPFAPALMIALVACILTAEGLESLFRP